MLFESEKGIGHKLEKRLIYAAAWFLLLGCVKCGDAATAQQLLGDISDGSLAPSVHLITLHDEEGATIRPEDEPVQPFSTQQTCGRCHNYKTISSGWHFNAADPNFPSQQHGRPGQPWILADASIATQIPLSYRPWPGAFRPEQLGITPFKFTTRFFGRHMPGGGAGETESPESNEIMRQFVSGKLEINCLICHNAHPGQDQAEYAAQIARQNLRWAAAGACEFASVKGMAARQPDTYDPLMSKAISTTYREGTFDEKNQVLFDIVRKVPNERCYYCHSNVNVSVHGNEKWTADEDIHLTAGMTCVDCHRNGLDHNIVRGYEGEDEVSHNELAATTTCEACHLGKGSLVPQAGRLGAPVPKHPGIPPIHFEKLTCTACHSGPWPVEKTYRSKTSRAHALGVHGASRSPDVLPHILFPVLAQQQDGKIGPSKLIWPAYWGTLKDGGVTPIVYETVQNVVGTVIGADKVPPSGDWPALTAELVAEALKSLQKDGGVEGKAVYICGGKLYQLDDAGLLSDVPDHPAAKPYMWPLAHNVRPAAQSLGIRYCEDCHATDGPFLFGKVAVDSPFEFERQSVKKMIEFQGIDPLFNRVFAFTFVFRPWLKVVVLCSCTILAAVLLLYALKALACVAKALVGNNH
jgi:hypothetical protein